MDARQMRARLERALKATPPRITAEGIRMAMFKRCRGRVFDVELSAAKARPGLDLVVKGDTRAPEKETAAYMSKLARIAAEVSELGVVHLVLRGLEGLPIDGPTDDGEHRIRLL